VSLYREVAQEALGSEAREHTAQVPPAVRQQREDDFRSAKLPVLYCSATMELGVDIARLNVVNLRNVPPTPANYAQRSGRWQWCRAASPRRASTSATRTSCGRTFTRSSSRRPSSASSRTSTPFLTARETHLR
jgi:Lhr-like helicase